MKVCHFTSVHRPEDIRIFQKECVSLAKEGHEVYLVQRGDSYYKSGIHIVGFGELPKGKLKRITQTANKAYHLAKDLDCEVYHFHDPELLPYGLKLKKAGKKVIFDSHEDVPAQIMDKEWIPSTIRCFVSTMYRTFETKVVSRIDAVIAATPHIASRFQERAKIIEVVNNYPMLDDIQFQDRPFKERDNIICYAGGINEIRGEKVMIEAMNGVDSTLVIAGDHDVQEIDNVKYLGRIDHSKVNELFAKSRAGIVIYQPAKNHIESQPIKLFELMAAGLPVVASNFPLWREIVEDTGCGICVDPTSVKEVRNACNELLFDLKKSEEMGRKGRNAILNSYSWDNEKQKLIDVYKYLEG